MVFPCSSPFFKSPLSVGRNIVSGRARSRYGDFVNERELHGGCMDAKDDAKSLEPSFRNAECIEVVKSVDWGLENGKLMELR